jgi:hypothetical protein
VLIVDAPLAGIARRWMERRERFTVSDLGTRHAWWALFAAWLERAPSPCFQAIDAFLAASEIEATALDWVASG